MISSWPSRLTIIIMSSGLATVRPRRDHGAGGRQLPLRDALRAPRREAAGAVSARGRPDGCRSPEMIPLVEPIRVRTRLGTEPMDSAAVVARAAKQAPLCTPLFTPYTYRGFKRKAGVQSY